MPAEPDRPKTITVPMRHAVRTVIDGATITVLEDHAAEDPSPAPASPDLPSNHLADQE